MAFVEHSRLPGLRAAVCCLALLLAAGHAGAGEPASGPENGPAAKPASGPAGSSASKPAGSLGSYEQAALDRALAARRLVIDHAPAGKVLRTIHVVNFSVFGKDDAFLTWLNIFHRTTRENIVRREVLLRPGQVWDQGVVEESLRRLRDPVFSALAVIVPVVAPEPGQVDLLVVTRDIWSLRLNSRYELQGSTLTQLVVAPSENNLFGWRKMLSLLFEMDQGSYTVGPFYLDKNLGGTRMEIEARGAVIVSRETNEPEGQRASMLLTYPLWSLEQDWGATLDVSHFDGVVRSFQGTGLRSYDNEDTPEVEAVPWRYGLRSTQLESTVTRALGDGIKHHLTAGYTMTLDRPMVPADFSGDMVLRAAFVEDVLPPSERTSGLLLRYRLFTPSFHIFRNVDTYDLPEEIRLGPDLQAELAVAHRVLGSEADFLGLAGRVAWIWRVGHDGFASALLEASGRLQDGALINNLVLGELRGITPTLGRLLRLVARVDAAALVDDRRNRFLVVDGGTGLRGYDIGAFTGTRRVRMNLEARSLPVRVWFSRVGVLAFWDMGHAADSVDELSMRHDLGLGLRVLIPQLQPLVFRLDWAIPLQGAAAGLPGRIIAGAEQAF